MWILRLVAFPGWTPVTVLVPYDDFDIALTLTGYYFADVDL